MSEDAGKEAMLQQGKDFVLNELSEQMSTDMLAVGAKFEVEETQKRHQGELENEVLSLKRKIDRVVDTSEEQNHEESCSTVPQSQPGTGERTDSICRN